MFEQNDPRSALYDEPPVYLFPPGFCYAVLLADFLLFSYGLLRIFI